MNNTKPKKVTIKAKKFKKITLKVKDRGPKKKFKIKIKSKK